MNSFRTANSPPLTRDQMDAILDTRTPVRTDYNLARSAIYDKTGQLGYKFSNLSRQRLGQQIVVNDDTWKSFFSTHLIFLSMTLKKYFGSVFQLIFQSIYNLYHFFECIIYKALVFIFGLSESSNNTSYDDEYYFRDNVKTSVLRKGPVTVKKIFNVNRIDRSPSKFIRVLYLIKNCFSGLCNAIIVCARSLTSIILSKSTAATSKLMNNNMIKFRFDTSRGDGVTSLSRRSRRKSAISCCFYLLPFLVLLLAILFFFLVDSEDREATLSRANAAVQNLVQNAVKNVESIKDKSITLTGDVINKGMNVSSDVYSEITKKSAVFIQHGNEVIPSLTSTIWKVATYLKDTFFYLLSCASNFLYQIMYGIFSLFYFIYTTLVVFIIDAKNNIQNINFTIGTAKSTITNNNEKISISTVNDKKVNIPLFDEDAFMKKILSQIQIQISNAISNIDVKEREVKVIEKHIEKVPALSIENIMSDIRVMLNKEISNVNNKWEQKLQSVAEEIKKQQDYSISNLRASIDGIPKEIIHKPDNSYIDKTIKNSFDELRKEIQLILVQKIKEAYESGQPKDMSTLNGYKMDMTQIYNMVMEVLEKYDNDKTNLPDYALESSGGTVLGTRCTKTYNDRSRIESSWGIPLWYVTGSPRTVIQRKSQSVIPGDCWCFEGNVGFLTISLSYSIHVKQISYEHASLQMLPSLDAASAPREIKFWSFNDENDHETKVDLGTFIYNISGKPLQFFNITSGRDVVTPIVEMEVRSNYGSKYTCLYRLRVHGDLPEKQLS